jgi:hypothetical protein
LSGNPSVPADIRAHIAGATTQAERVAAMRGALRAATNYVGEAVDGKERSSNT